MSKPTKPRQFYGPFRVCHIKKNYKWNNRRTVVCFSIGHASQSSYTYYNLNTLFICRVSNKDFS